MDSSSPGPDPGPRDLRIGGNEVSRRQTPPPWLQTPREGAKGRPLVHPLPAPPQWLPPSLPHAHPEALLEAAVLALVPVMLVDLAVTVGPVGNAEVTKGVTMTPTFWPGSHHVRRLRKLHLETTRPPPIPTNNLGWADDPKVAQRLSLQVCKEERTIWGSGDREEQSVAKWISMPEGYVGTGFEGRIQAPQVTRGSSWQNTNDGQKFSSYILLGPCQARGQVFVPGHYESREGTWSPESKTL